MYDGGLSPVVPPSLGFDDPSDEHGSLTSKSSEMEGLGRDFRRREWSPPDVEKAVAHRRSLMFAVSGQPERSLARAAQTQTYTYTRTHVPGG